MGVVRIKAIMNVLSDRSVITNLAAIQHLQLLPRLYEQITIPKAVYRELAKIDPPVPGTLEVQTAPWIRESPQPPSANFAAAGFWAIAYCNSANQGCMSMAKSCPNFTKGRILGRWASGEDAS
jgi:hypothetical protein